MPLPLILASGAMLSSAFGLNKYLQARNTLNNPFDIETQKKMLEQYRDELGIGKDFTYSAGAFDSYVQTRQDNVDKITDVFKDAAIQEALKKSSELKEKVQGALFINPGKPDPADANKMSGGLAAAQAEYEETSKVFGGLLKKLPPFKAEQILQTMKELIDQGVKNIEAQQAFEKAHLKEQFQDSKFTDLLKNNGVTNSDRAKTSMLADLDKMHATQLTAFKDSTAASLRQLHDAARKEIERINFLAILSENNEQMREAIRLKAGELRAKQGLQDTLVAAIGGDKKTPGLGIVQISDLETIHTRTGKTITQKNGEFTLELGATLFNPRYYLLGNKVEADMELLAHAVKAQGHTSIEMDIKLSNSELIIERAKQAYEACINAGFSPDKIKIYTQGKELKIDDIFGKNSTLPNEFKARAEQIQANEKALDVKPGGDTNAVKEELKNLRAEAAEKAKNAQATTLDDTNIETPTPT